MSKRKPRLINEFQKSQEFQNAFELYKQKTQGEIEDQPTTLSEPQIEGGMNLVEPQFEPQNDPPLRVGCQQPQNEGAFEGAISDPLRPSEVEGGEGEFVTLDEVQEFVDEVHDLREDNVQLHDEISKLSEHINQGEKDIDQLKEFTDYGENVRHYQAWNKFINKARGDSHDG